MKKVARKSRRKMATAYKQKDHESPSHPTVKASNPAAPPPAELGPNGMPPEELSYRMMLQEAILWVTQRVLEEQREVILKRAADRVRTLQELRV